ncbi:AAA family ATPase [Flavobacterium lipolyticum]|uniref:ATP-binding protein n=1 Tax=Flavobacterium lipolyticum TaxID=2893754 RepID=A0ABS8M1S5_9FLAO|nr:AAA family ATPase [Flavobacterium sp. F-126]MCC9018792.1 ATP-binding protein [Flavobacterium sp. F-126]
MERARLVVKNFGPLKDINIEVREMVTFIGAQASGKSTLAKLISILEDEDFRRDDTISFEEELKKYNIFNYLKKDTFISYDNINYLEKSPYSLDYKEGIFLKGTAYRYLSVIKELSKDKSLNQKKLTENLKEILCSELKDCLLKDLKKTLDIFPSKTQKNKFKKFISTEILITTFKKIGIDKIFEILDKEQNTENYIKLYEDLISLLPNLYLFDSLYIPSERSFLHLIEGNVIGLIKNKIQIPDHILNIGQEYEKAIQTIKELPLSIIDKKIKYKREGKTSYIYHNENEKVNLLESASGLQSIIPILLLVEYSKTLKEKYNFNFVVEEPELNLYPKAQHELIKYLVKNCLFDRKNLILTTHSPFVLASINNLLLAYDKGQKNPKEVNKIINKESWLNPKNFIAYELKNGKAKKIMNDRLGQISENMIDSVSDTFADEFDKLLDL